MRLATFNLLHGVSLPDGLVDPDRLRAAVRTLDADVVGLQEVDRDQQRSGLLHLTEIAAAAAGATDWRFAAAITGTPGERWRAAVDADEAEPGPAYGVALLSRRPVRQWRLVRLPAAPVRSPVLLPGSRRLLLLPDEPRVGLAAVVDSAQGPLTVVTTHLSFVPGWNAVQLRLLLRGLRGLPRPQVLLGDLNLPGPVPAAVTRWTALARLLTYPSPQPRWQIDHLLSSGGLPAATAASAVQLPLSDHRALVVDLPI